MFEEVGDLVDRSRHTAVHTALLEAPMHVALDRRETAMADLQLDAVDLAAVETRTSGMPALTPSDLKIRASTGRLYPPLG